MILPSINQICNKKKFLWHAPANTNSAPLPGWPIVSGANFKSDTDLRTYNYTSRWYEYLESFSASARLCHKQVIKDKKQQKYRQKISYTNRISTVKVRIFFTVLLGDVCAFLSHSSSGMRYPNKVSNKWHSNR